MKPTLFVANRGEPVTRAHLTAQRLGVRLVGVVARDELTCGWPRVLDGLTVEAAGRSPYGDPARLAQAARTLGADWVWPAWGFLSEAQALAVEVQRAGMVWVGPPPQALALFGDKLKSRDAALQAGLPVIEQVRVDGPEDVTQVRSRLSHYPLLVKGAYGGGGKGQLVVENDAELDAGIASAMRQNLELFGSETLLVEPFLQRPRHVEVQVLADRSGKVLVLGTRDCSCQRRFQKVIEEAPAPGITLPPEIEGGLQRLLGAVEYATAGTVEFLVADGRFYFLEVNPRLQVEHTVTEETTRVAGQRLDLLQWMIATAQGETLPFVQADIECGGHAIEARVYAEDVWQDYLPQTGVLQRVRWPSGDGLRVDAALKACGEPLLPRYDPMLGKVIAVHDHREGAMDRLDAALEQTRLMGLPTNVALIQGILRHDDFRNGQLDTGMLSEIEPVEPLDQDILEAAALLVAYETIRRNQGDNLLESEDTPLAPLEITLQSLAASRRAVVAKEGVDRYQVSGTGRVQATVVGGQTLVLGTSGREPSYVDFCLSGREVTVYGSGGELRTHFALGSQRAVVDPHVAPTGGVLCQFVAPEGATVSPGAPLYILESMKMETTVVARWPGRVVRRLAEAGALVERGEEIVVLEATRPMAESHPQTQERADQSREPLEPADVAWAILGYDLDLDALDRLPPLGEEAMDEVCRAAEHMLLLEETCAHPMEATLTALRGSPLTSTDGQTKDLLDQVARTFGVPDRLEFAQREDLFERFLHARRTMAFRRDVFYRLLATTTLWSDQLGVAVARWYPLLPSPKETALKERLLSLVSERAPRHYYELRQPPVAMEYWQEWLDTMAPHAARAPAMDDPFELSELPRKEWLLDRWFKEFTCRPLFRRTIPEADLHFVEAQRGDEPKRLIALAHIWPFAAPEPHRALPELERAAIAAYGLVRRLEGRGYQPNHVFLSVDDDCVIPWGEDRVAVERCATVAARIGGFASGLRIDATESFLNLGDGPRLLVVRHAPEVGIVSSPPFPLAERRCEDDPQRWLDSRQQRMGKHTNRERMRLLFDDAHFEVVPLPHDSGHRLDVYQGTVAGRPAVVYANDFRRMGGALGEAEGQRLTLAVLYAYFTDRVAIALHDGAGANVKESAASLVWAGAYFGAVAVTGGRAAKSRFSAWWTDHRLQPVMKRGLEAAGITDFFPRGPLPHVHLHVGAAVGMLVYGPSISGLSIMVDQPHAYRVLTGSKAVAVTLGEKMTNYQLGGAPVHARCSGDVDVVVPTEARAYELVRYLLGQPCDAGPTDPPASAWQCSPDATVLFPKDALREVLDPGFFLELRPDLDGTRSVTTAVSRLAGQTVVVAALGAAAPLSGKNAWKKLYHAVRTAADWRLPLLLAFGGEQRPGRESRDELFERREFIRLVAEHTPPKLGILFGEDAAASPLADGLDCLVQIVGPSESEHDAVGHLSAPRFDGAFARAGALLATLSAARNRRDFAKARTTPQLPDNLASAYDPRAVVTALVDRGSFIEFWSGRRDAVVCGIATIGGLALAVIADDTEVQGGAQTRSSLVRFTQFGRIIRRWGLPLVQFNDSPAFMPGSRQEQAGIQGAGGRSLLEEVLTETPTLAVTLRQSYGGRLIHANLPSLGPPRQAIALDYARMGVMGAAGAATVLYKGGGDGLDEWKRDYEARYLAASLARQAGAVDSLTSLPDLRTAVLQWRKGV